MKANPAIILFIKVLDAATSCLGYSAGDIRNGLPKKDWGITMVSIAGQMAANFKQR